MTYLQEVQFIRQLMAQGNVVKAEQHCRQLLQQQPQVAEAWFLLSQIAAIYNQLPEALACIEHAVSREPANAHYQVFMAHIQLQLRQAEQAYQRLKPLMVAQHELSVVQLFGRASWQAGYFADALSAFKTIAYSQPISEANVLPYARALAAMGRRAEVLNELERLEQADKLQAESALLKSHTGLHKAGKVPSGEVLAKYCEKFTNHPGLQQLKALFLSWHDNEPLAEHLFNNDYQLASVKSALSLREPGSHLAGLPTDVLEHAVSNVSIDGLWLEFGVCFGRSINLLAALHDGIIHGFDSFEGLPEDWKPGEPKGSYSTNGRTPEVAVNVRLHRGWFEQTLPAFLQHQDEPVAFVHIDCDLYSSTATVLSHLAKRFVAGTVIVFDDFYGYDGFENHEFKAFFEAVANHSLKFKLLSYAALSREVAFILQ